MKILGMKPKIVAPSVFKGQGLVLQIVFAKGDLMPLIGDLIEVPLIGLGLFLALVFLR